MPRRHARTRFDGRVLMVGFGTIGRCLLPMLLDNLAIEAPRVQVLDGEDHESVARTWVERGVGYSVRRVDRHNLAEIMQGLARRGDVLVNVSMGIDSVALADWCQEAGVSYVDSSIEPWEEEIWNPNQAIRERTEYAYHQSARNHAAARWRPRGPSAVVCHGANPGLVSHFVKAALRDLAAALDIDAGVPESASDWAALAERTGTRVIHVAERDTQVSRDPKRPGEFVNTWSVPGFLEEASMPVEVGWGTHEKTLPPDALHHPGGPGNAIYLPRAAARAWIRSWVPLGGQIDGLALPHSESITISEYLTAYRGEGVRYRPTVAFSYLPCDAALASLHESVMRDWAEPESVRIQNEDIVEGRDELGVLLMGHALGGWWYGSQLDVHEARRLVPGNNPTALQVASGVLAATLWVIDNPRRGYLEPEALPHDWVLEVARPYLGPMVSRPTDWSPLQGRQRYFDEASLDPEDPWQFGNFFIV